MLAQITEAFLPNVFFDVEPIVGDVWSFRYIIRIDRVFLQCESSYAASVLLCAWIVFHKIHKHMVLLRCESFCVSLE